VGVGAPTLRAGRGLNEPPDAAAKVELDDGDEDDELDTEAKLPTRNAWALTRNVDNPLFPWTDFFTGCERDYPFWHNQT
jgi:hypothetical protein